VEPGFGGQKLIPECIDKVAVIRRMVTEKGLQTDIQVDGGIQEDNVELALRAGANIFVAGSSVFKGDVQENAKKILEKLK
jgi:ribulose-phosphate 3-epimerase